jgi:hypothetical protein
VLFIVLATACSKKGDDMACPKASDDNSSQQRLVQEGTGVPADIGSDRPQGGNRDPLLNGSGNSANDGSISDDGDDEADNEGPNKRGRNN